MLWLHAEHIKGAKSQCSDLVNVTHLSHLCHKSRWRMVSRPAVTWSLHPADPAMPGILPFFTWVCLQHVYYGVHGYPTINILNFLCKV